MLIETEQLKFRFKVQNTIRGENRSKRGKSRCPEIESAETLIH